MKGVMNMVEKFETMIFDERCMTWTKNPEYNKLIVRHAEQYLRDKCNLLGWISLNDVYDELGLPRKLEAQVVGWRGIDSVAFAIMECQDNPLNIEIRFINLIKLL